MTESNDGGGTEYAFDLAVSFAGHDRRFVEDVVRAVNSDLRVFYDEDFKVDMWGEDLVEYFTNLYQHKARYAVVYISAQYADSAWTNVERRSVLARAMTQSSAYVLPIRLDDTNLPGLLPTVSYMDARREGIDGIARAIQQKVGTVSSVSPITYSGGVADTPEELQALLSERPPAWEYLLYASLLKQGRDALAEARRDHDIGYGAPTGRRIENLETELRPALQAVLSDLNHTIDSLNKVLGTKALAAAMGARGEPGDPDRILHIGRRFVDVYERFLDIAANIRGTSVPSEWNAIMEVAARLTDQPLQDLDKFIDYFVPLMDKLPARLMTGENVDLALVVTVTVDSDLGQEMVNMLKSLAA
jgi:hypothetical protein